MATTQDRQPLVRGHHETMGVVWSRTKNMGSVSFFFHFGYWKYSINMNNFAMATVWKRFHKDLDHMVQDYPTYYELLERLEDKYKKYVERGTIYHFFSFLFIASNRPHHWRLHIISLVNFPFKRKWSHWDNNFEIYSLQFSDWAHQDDQVLLRLPADVKKTRQFLFSVHDRTVG